MAGTQFSLRALLVATGFAAISAAMVSRSGAYGAATACTFCACAAIVSLWHVAALRHWRVFAIGLCGATVLAAIVFTDGFYETSTALGAQLTVYHLVNDWSDSSWLFIFCGSVRAGLIFSAAFTILYLVSIGANRNGWRRGCSILFAFMLTFRPAQVDLAVLQGLGELEFWARFHFSNPNYDGASIVCMHGLVIATQVLGGAIYLRELIRRRPQQAMAIATLLLLFHEWAAVVWLDPMNDYL